MLQGSLERPSGHSRGKGAHLVVGNRFSGLVGSLLEQVSRFEWWGHASAVAGRIRIGRLSVGVNI